MKKLIMFFAVLSVWFWFCGAFGAFVFWDWAYFQFWKWETDSRAICLLLGLILAIPFSVIEVRTRPNA